MPDTEDMEDLTARALLQQLLQEVRESNAQIKVQMSAQNIALSSRIELLEAQNNLLRARLEVGGTTDAIIQTHGSSTAPSQLPTPSGSKNDLTFLSKNQDVAPSGRPTESTSMGVLHGNEVVSGPKVCVNYISIGAAVELTAVGVDLGEGLRGR